MRPLAVYPGTFDPVTLGHVDIAACARRLFPPLRVAVVERSSKPLLLPAAERVELVRGSLEECGLEGVEVDLFDGLLVDYMKRVGASIYIRGLRAISDFEYEFQMQLMNRKLAPEITGVYLMPSENNMYLSSTMVREIAANGGGLSTLVSPCVEKALRRMFGGRPRREGS